MRLSARKILFTFLFVFVIASTLFTTKTFATYIVNLEPGIPQNLHTNTQIILIESLSAINCQLTGVDLTNPTGECLSVKQDGTIGYSDSNGAIQVFGKLISMLYDSPIKTGDFTNYFASNFGMVKTASADTGFEGLSPILGVWKVFRDITYLFFILIFVFIGLGVMLRVKIDPRTVMTIQNQIPKVIVALIAITFSYAIAGLLIDFMWISILFSFSLFAPIDPASGAEFSIVRMTEHLGDTPFGFLSKMMSGHLGFVEIPANAAGSIADIVYDLLMGSTTMKVISILFLEGPLGWGARGLNAILPGDHVPVISGGKLLVGGVAFLVVAIAILFSLFRVWFMLLRAYITILLDVILAPVWIMAGLFPGVSGGRGLGPWLRHIGTNILVFPVIIGFFLIGKLVMDGFTNAENSFVPPLIGSANAENFAGLIGLGIILMSPKVHDFVQESLKPPKIDLNPVFGALGKGTKSVQNVATTAFNRQAKTVTDYGTLVYDKNRFLGQVASRIKYGKPREKTPGTA